MKHLFDKSDIDVYTTEYINFSVGAPGPDLLETCCQLFKDATEQRMNYEKDNNSFLFQYGPAAGIVDFREALSAFLSSNYENPVNADDLILTAGATHGMHLVWTILLNPDAVIIVDEVTYMIALESLANFPWFKVLSIPLQEDGPDLQVFEEVLQKNKVKGASNSRYNCMYYTIPIHHNPTGIAFSKEKCTRLVEMSRTYEFLILCDDVYNLLNYDSALDLPPRLFAFDDPRDNDYKGTVISNGSFSKILAPGVRVGWLELPRWAWKILDGSGILRSGGAVNNYMSGIITTLLDTGSMQAQLDFYQSQYQQRMNIACQILSTELHPSVRYFKPKGGYFIWLTFPPDFDAVAFNELIRKEYKVSGIPGTKFSPCNSFGNCLRLCAVFHKPDVIEKGMRQLCLATREWFLSNARQ